MTFTHHIQSPVGSLELRSDDGRLTAVSYSNAVASAPRRQRTTPPERIPDILTRAEVQLTEYFDGHRTEFDLPLSPSGTDFQRRVWNELRRIPWGARISYADLALRIGSPDAVRAVGAANGRNPIAIIIPCHRVVGADGSLTGYAGGIERKRRLLDLESGALSLFEDRSPRSAG